jgi:hypothetical protein
MKSTILFAFALTLVVAMVASTPIENSEDASAAQTLVKLTGEEVHHQENHPEGRKFIVQSSNSQPGVCVLQGVLEQYVGSTQNLKSTQNKPITVFYRYKT